LDVVRVGEHADDPRVDERRFGELPALRREVALQDGGEVASDEALELGVYRRVVELGEVPAEAAEVGDVLRHDAAGVVEVAGRDEVV
jgi:hypothetical protein